MCNEPRDAAQSRRREAIKRERIRRKSGPGAEGRGRGRGDEKPGARGSLNEGGNGRGRRKRPDEIPSKGTARTANVTFRARRLI
jgi:hypothetical protein